jgi:hypothetical protein
MTAPLFTPTMPLNTLSTADLLELIAAYRSRTSRAIELKKAAEEARVAYETHMAQKKRDDQDLRDQLEECTEEQKVRVIITWMIHDDRGSKLETEDVKRRLEGMTPEEKVQWVFEERQRSDWDDI